MIVGIDREPFNAIIRELKCSICDRAVAVLLDVVVDENKSVLEQTQDKRARAAALGILGEEIDNQVCCRAGAAPDTGVAGRSARLRIGGGDEKIAALEETKERSDQQDILLLLLWRRRETWGSCADLPPGYGGAVVDANLASRKERRENGGKN